ncbi:antibiotic biosynthesis monooxygenase [Metapseudomonas lalkuanensis]|uniref:Antibiotic biosynthesis monooxygenase n=1 Tax=Metapseudomonas lalkuanensis TaxID=2604832 RepID=A0A5J6QP22_9GAMM|nr:antibiotic biosynthesis monooxygenase [Pseudomonas lalkuanensis]QEY64230.1 antibiotic biosynthesis monooxygenase [Pseudomonas lalkuanensis]UCO96847.1 antibiotic biosynthesis monooxygenase [Pseudomonas lalkuanensis]
MPADNVNKVVTLLIRHRVRQGQLDSYESWLRRIVQTAQGYPGHLGVDVIHGKEGDHALFTSVLRFSSADHLQSWLDSDDRRRLVEEVTPLLASDEDLALHSAREFWFAPEHVPGPPPRWKQASITFAVILPLSLLVPLMWQPLFAIQPWLGGHLASNTLITLTIVLLVVYLFMPWVTRWLAPWLSKP